MSRISRLHSSNWKVEYFVWIFSGILKIGARLALSLCNSEQASFSKPGEWCRIHECESLALSKPLNSPQWSAFAYSSHPQVNKMSHSFHSPLSRARNSGWNWKRNRWLNHLHPKLLDTKDLSDSLQEIAQGLITIQNQLDSLAAIVLQKQKEIRSPQRRVVCAFF